jgi:hypothetical protein
VQREILINEQQLQRLNQIFGQGLDRTRQSLNALREAERAQRLAELSRSFNAEFMRSAGDILNEQQMLRFNQLNLQQQGLGAFTDPQLQKQLLLTEQQLLQLRKAGDVFDRDLQGILRDAAAADAQRRFDALMRLRSEQINSVLNQQQQQSFQRMIGQPFTFPMPTSAPSKPLPPRR